MSIIQLAFTCAFLPTPSYTYFSLSLLSCLTAQCNIVMLIDCGFNIITNTIKSCREIIWFSIMAKILVKIQIY